MENEHTSTKEGQYQEELAAMYQTKLSAINVFESPQILQIIVENLVKYLEASTAMLYQYDRAKKEFVSPAIAVGVSAGFLREVMPCKGDIAYQIVTEEKPIIADRMEELVERDCKFISTEPIASLAGFPLKVQGDIVGVMFVGFHCYHRFTSVDVEKVFMSAHLAAVAIHNAEMFKQQEADKRLRVLQQAQKAIDSATKLQEVLEQILTKGLEIVETKQGSLMLIEGEYLINKAQAGPAAGPGHQKMKFKVGEGIAGYVAETGKAVLCPDVLEDDRFQYSPGRKEVRFRSLLAVPIISHENKVLGVISVDDPEPHHFHQAHEQLLSDMAHQFAAAIEKMVLVDTLDSLHQIFERITSIAIVDRELSVVLSEIAKNATEILKIDVITIYQYDQTTGEFLVPPLMEGISQNQRMRMVTEVFEGEAPWVLVHELKKNHYASDAQSDSTMNPKRPLGRGPGFVTREGIKSSAALLLKVREEVVGVMFVNYRTSHGFPPRETKIIEMFASSAAIAIQDVREWNRMRKAGIMASGIAHNLKNPLANIVSTINILELGYIVQNEIPFKLEEIKDEVRRSRDIIDSFLNLSRSLPVGGAVDVRMLVSDVLNRLRDEAEKHSIYIDESLLSQVPLIQGDAPRLREVFVNILKNAVEAMPDGGKLTVSTFLDKRDIRVEIKDTGVGISPENQKHIFDPFVTTKETGSGTGLGLTISDSIIRDHHGRIKVESREGSGSTFVVILPRGDVK